MRDLFDDLRVRIEGKKVDAVYLRRSDARSLAAALVDTIMWGNFERVMDTLQVSRHHIMLSRYGPNFSGDNLADVCFAEVEMD